MSDKAAVHRLGALATVCCRLDDYCCLPAVASSDSSKNEEQEGE